MANKAISELPQALNVNNQDLFVLEQSGIAKKLTAETFITEQGIIDALAEALDGHGGIASVTLSSVSGRIRTYLITFADETTTTFQVLDGTSISRIEKTSTAGLVDTYTVYMSDGTTTFFQVRNGQDGSATWDQINSKAPIITDTVTGAIANFPDGADDIPVVDLTVDIEPVQDLKYGSPYPAGGGKNKLNILTASDTLNNVAIVSNNDTQSITLNGTASASGASAISMGSCTIPAGSYLVSVNNPISGISDYSLVRLKNGSTTVADVSLKSGADVSFTLESEATLSMVCRVQSGDVFQSKTINVMVRNSSVADNTWQPYSNICPITGFTGANVTRTGANVWDEETAQGTVNSSTGVISKSIYASGLITNNYISVEPETEYLIATSASALSSANARTRFYDADKVYIGYADYNGSSVHYNASFKTPTGCYYMMIEFQAEYGLTYNNDISINYPSTDTQYHPYQGTTLTVDWTTEAGTVYGGTLDVTTGVLTVDRAMVDLGTLFWGYSSGLFYTNGISSTSINWANWSGTPPLVCSAYKAVSNATFDNSDYCVGYAYNSAQLRAKDSRYTDATSFTSAVSGVQLVYELATPQTYQLTPQEVRTLLGTNNIFSDCSSVEVEYRADTKLYIENLTQPAEDDLVANQAITSGKYFMIGNSLYLALANIASGAQITIGTNAQRVSLADALNAINS